MKRVLYISLGLLCVGLGILGAFLPVMPATVFFIMAAYFFARSSETLYHKLISHPKFGPVILNWEANRTMPRKAKIIAITMTTVGTTASLFAPVPWFVKVGLVIAALVMLIILIRIQTNESFAASRRAHNSKDSLPLSAP